MIPNVVAAGLLLICCAFPTAVRAVQVEDLYVGEVLVPASAGDSRALRAGAQEALLQVLVRVSGSTGIEQEPRIASALRQPDSYYYQYGYDTTSRMIEIDGEEQPARVLRVSFEPSAVARLLRSAGLPVWGSNRPGTLVWVAFSDDSGRRLITESDEGDFAQALGLDAAARGLPILYPLLDIEDTRRLSTAEVWGLFSDRIGVASLRYNPDVILAGRVQQTPGGAVTGRWIYRIEDRWLSFEGTGATVEEVASAIVDRLTNELAERYAVGSTRTELYLRVEAVERLEDYAALSAYLESLTPVVDSSVVEVADDEVLFRLQTEGQVEQLREIIDLDEKLIFISGDDTLRYRWLSN